MATPDLAKRDKTSMLYFVYFLQSGKNGDLYIGSTQDVEKRVMLHNRGRVRSTKAYRPWKLLGQEEYMSRSEAFRREHFLKTHQQKELLKTKYGLVDLALRDLAKLRQVVSHNSYTGGY